MEALFFEYFERRRREFKRYSSGVLTDRELDGMFGMAADGRAALVFANVPLDDRAFVAIRERLVVSAVDLVEIIEYSYYLVDLDAGEVRGYDLDPSHTPPAHRHVGSDHRREPCGRVTLRQAIEDFWDQLDDLRSQEDEPGRG